MMWPSTSRALSPLFLLLLLTEGESQKSFIGAHTLRYDLTAVSLEGSRQPQFWALGYLDDELFLRYNGDNRMAEPWGLRMKGPMGAETWARETEELQEKEQQLRMMLAEVMRHHRHHRGHHSLQATLGCELQGNHNTGGSWRLGYNGQNSLTLDLETFTWKNDMTSAKPHKKFWERHGPRADQVKTFLHDTCPDQLQRHLVSLRDHLVDTGPPVVTVTHLNTVDRTILTCRAFNLYPRITALTWLWDGEPVQQTTSGPGAFLPSGDGTYQTWVSTQILPGEEPQFTCHVQHGSHNIIKSAFLGKELRELSALESWMQDWEKLTDTITTHFLAPAGPQDRSHAGITNTATALAVSIILPVMLVLLNWACRGQKKKTMSEQNYNSRFRKYKS